MSNAFNRLFRDHPREVNETYLEHMAASAGFGLKLLRLAGCAFIHALAPGLHRTTVSDAVRAMAQDMGDRAAEARECRMRDTGAWDAGL